MPVDQIVAIALGGTLIVVALAWRTADRHRARRLLSKALLDPDSAVRSAALSVVARAGMTRFADLLLARTVAEESESVRRRLVEVVVANQWEPAATPQLVELRLWAYRQLQAEQAEAGDE